MPRKQRFKPSRKPKPNPPVEDGVIGREISGTTAPGSTTPPRELSPEAGTLPGDGSQSS